MSVSTLTKKYPNSWRSWPAPAKKKLRDELRQRVYEKQSADVEVLPVGPFDNFVEATTTFRLDDWQRHLCRRLELLREQTGQRLLIHAPPQYGKSVLVSQRFPAWLLAARPKHRVKLACYNITHAARFGKVIRDLMQSREYARMFPAPGLRLPDVTSAEEWSTLARLSLRDAQPSFKALGLATGFVGQGADTLIIDDPYASPQEAASLAIRESVWMFWDESAKVRLTDDTNVIVMFHRYHEDDLAGRLIKQGGWELLRYAAIADGDEKMPDPMGRAVGERLTTRKSEEFLAQQQKSQAVWLGQFQGRPTARGGSFFQVGNLEIVPAAPAGLTMVRAWDMAATADDGDYSAGVKMGTAGDGIFYVANVKRGQWDTDSRDKTIKQTAALDGVTVAIRGPQDPGSAGKDAAKAFVRMLAGYTVETERVSGPKETRADPFSSQVNAGNVKLVAGDWNQDFIEELRVFPVGKNDDQVDAASDAFNVLSPPLFVPFSL